MASNVVDDITRALGIFQQQAGAAENETQQVYDALSGIANNDVGTIQVIGANQAIVDSTKLNAELTVQQEKIKKANELGIVPGKASDILTGLADTILTAGQAKAVALQKIAEKRSVGVLDNPLQWLINQFTVNQDIQEHNAADQQLNAATEQYQRVNQLTQQAAVTQTALAQSVTAASAQAATENTQLNAQLLANKAIKDGLIFNAQGIKQILEIKSQQLSSLFSMFNAEQSQARLNVELENAARLREQFEWKKQEKDLLERDDNAILDTINKGGMMRMGDQYQMLKPGTAAASNAIALLKSNSPVGKVFQEDYLSGMQGVIAADPFTALDRMKTQAVRLAPTQIPVRNVLEEALKQVQSMPGFDPRNAPAVKAAVNAKTKEILDAQVRDIKPDDAANVFSIPSIAAVIKNVPELSNLPVVQKLLGARITAGDNLNDPDAVFQAVAKGVQSGKITYQEALDLPYLYQRGVALNLAARNLDNFGMVTSNDNNKYAYNTRVTTNPATPFGGKEVVDLTKVDAVARGLNKYMAQEFKVQVNEALERVLGDTFRTGITPGALAGRITERAMEPRDPRSFYPDLFDPKSYGLGGQP